MFRTLPDTGGWSVHFGMAAEALNAPVRRSLYVMFAGGLLSLGLGGGLAWLTARDIAQRRREAMLCSAAALRTSEERRRMAVAAADLGTWRWDRNRNMISGSDRCRALLGVFGRLNEDGEWEGAADQVLARVHQADQYELRRAIEACVSAREAMAVEFRVVGEQGAVRWVRLAGRP